MSLSIANDGRMPHGGYAVLRGPNMVGVSALCVQNCFSGMFLGEDGRWGKTRFACPIDPIEGRPDAVCLGPHIVDFVPTDLQVAFFTQAGEELGKVIWADIIPSRNPGKVTSKDVLKDPPAKQEPQKDEIIEIPEPKIDPVPSRSYPFWMIALAVLCAAALAYVLWHRFHPKITPVNDVPPIHDVPPVRDVPPVHDTPPVRDVPPVHDTPPVHDAPPAHDTPVAPVHQTAPPHRSEPTEDTRGSATKQPGDQCPPADSAFEQGLQKYASDSLSDLYESERFLKCALAAGNAEAKQKLGRLYIKMATAFDGSYQDKRSYYRKACDAGDQEGCDKANFTLDH